MKKVAVIHTTPVTIPTLKKLLTENRRPDEEEIELEDEESGEPDADGGSAEEDDEDSVK